MTSTTVQKRPQLAPVRIGRGRAVHLGCLSSLEGPDGEPRYSAAWCGAGRRGDGDVTVGAAVTDLIVCRTCRRAAPSHVELVNAEVSADPTGFRYHDHDNDSEAWCPFSGEPVSAQLADLDDQRCPQGCADSRIEPDVN
jgi:hypothetical protein